ncbi:hypothetical protein [Carboxylicivirga sp. M1479]|uniref:hypothetical protein n=1 Tax=Carboxylicivirga sp. M1479 TaxID=2594476 RepID=UPI001177423F|nr:hypothetical protein [Carboxylicivirga sp. M1479]TRX70832.1 hypothetical protein FNN09_09220 [Carboxylicivirga sp. M1479]
MKKLLFILSLALLTNLTVKSQATTQEIGLIGSILKSEVKVFFAQNMDLATNEAETFWEIYEAYEAELKPMSQQRIKFLQSIAENEGKMTEEELDKTIQQGIKITKKRTSLRAKYYKQMKKKLGIKVASQFYQIDGYINAHISASLHEGLPLIIPTED